MLESLLNRLEKERRVIKGAPIHFSFACLIAVIILGLLWYAAFGTALSLQHSTIEAYKQKFGDISNPKDFASMENISDFFVSQPITNFDGTNLFLTYKPIPESLQILSPKWFSPSVLMERWGYMDGKTFIFTNGAGVSMRNDLNGNGSKVQYFRKSLH